MTSSCRHLHPSYRLTCLLMICFCQRSSSLPNFRQSSHIFLGDLLVTSSWLPDGNCLLTWLHFMISPFLHVLHSQELTTFLVSCSYTTTSYSMRTYYVDFICPCTDRYSSIDHTSKYIISLPATIWHDFIASNVSIYIYTYLIPFFPWVIL